MSTPREQVAAQIESDNPSWRVFNFAKRPANVSLGHPVVAVHRSTVEPSPESPLVLEHTVEVQAFGARTMDAEAEDEMDEILDGVWTSLERLTGYAVKSAKRATFYEGTLSGWEITAVAKSANVYRDTVMREREANA